MKKKGFNPTWNPPNPDVTWKLIDRGKSFTPVTGVCQLCIKEAFYILFRPELAKLNSRSEIFSACFHQKPSLLIKPKRKKRSPGIKWKLKSVQDTQRTFSLHCKPEDCIHCSCIFCNYVYMKLIVANNHMTHVHWLY